MKFRSIRWRLSLSFATVALLAALALGALLLVILQRYYAQREADYLRGNAQIISATLAKSSGTDMPRKAVQLQVESLAFLSQTRVRVLDLTGSVLYDSGLPTTGIVSLGFAQQDNLTTGASQRSEIKRIIALGDSSKPILDTAGKPLFDAALGGPDAALSPADSAALKKMLANANLGSQATIDIMTQKQSVVTAGQTLPDSAGAAPQTPADNVVFYRSLAVVGSPFGFALNGDFQPGGPRSAQTATSRYADSEGKPLGTVELSDGPALGYDILSSVAAGWAAASVLAVVLAAAVGWLISRRISAPVLALAQVTTRLANGDLSSRADAGDRDEFGQLAHAFNDMADQVQTTVDTLRRFVSDAAHELHSPLTALHTDLDLAADETDPARQRKYVAQARTMVARLEGLTGNLLDLSRIEAKPGRVRQSIDLVALLRAQVEVYASEAEQAGLAFEVALPAEVLPVCAEAAQVTRALNNLIENACKFTPPGGVIRCDLSHEAGRAVLSVSDSGIGIPAADLPQLFNRFHRGRNAVSYPGSGLGLAIVRAIMEQQGGSVVAEPQERGAKFVLRWTMDA